MEFEFTSIDRTLEFIKPLLVEGRKKVIVKTIFEDTWAEHIDHYLVIVSDNEFKHEG